MTGNHASSLCGSLVSIRNSQQVSELEREKGREGGSEIGREGGRQRGRKEEWEGGREGGRELLSRLSGPTKRERESVCVCV